MFENLDDLRSVINAPVAPDAVAMAKARLRQEQLTKPLGSLGIIEEIAVFMAGWRSDERPQLHKVLACIFAGNHAIAQKGVTAFPAAVTAQMVANFENGGAAINQLCKLYAITMRVIPLRLSEPVADFTEKPAMSAADFLEAINIGAQQVDKNTDLLLPGEMGIGNTSSASAVCFLLYGGRAQKWTGTGSGIDKDGLLRKINVIEQARVLHFKFCQSDPLAILQRVGGRELAAIIGSIIAARRYRIPVLLDGFIVASAAAVVHAINPDCLSHCLASHLSAESGHAILLDKLALKPILQMNMRLGEASGAALAYGIVKAALVLHNDMATFDEAKVAKRSR